MKYPLTDNPMKHFLKKIIAKILEWEARAVLKKYKPKVVAITGNVGKTSTKDAVYSILSSTFFVRKSEKSFNSDIGVPLTILGCPNAWTNLLLWVKNIWSGLELIFLPHEFPTWLVLEIGADRPGDIESIAKWLRPDVVVVTRFSAVPVHVEFFKSREHLIEEKGYLVKALKTDGVLVLNYDDPDVLNFRTTASSKVITFGFTEGAHILGSHVRVMYEADRPSGISFKVNVGGSSIPVSLPGVLGLQHLYPVIAAVAVGHSQNINMVDISQALSGHLPPRGRMNLVEGKNGSTIIDDTYNASPVALHEALMAFKEVTVPGKKIVCLGDMMELGKFSVDSHVLAGKEAAGVAELIITVGVRSQYIKEGALAAGINPSAIISFDNSVAAGEYLSTLVGKGDLVLVKGSQSMRMERLVERIMAHPELKEKLLVRQEEEWLKRK